MLSQDWVPKHCNTTHVQCCGFAAEETLVGMDLSLRTGKTKCLRVFQSSKKRFTWKTVLVLAPVLVAGWLNLGMWLLNK